MRVPIRALMCFCVFLSTMFAQSPPTNNILTRTTMIQSQYGRGTAFSIDVDKREYWITAKHILTGAKHPPYGKFNSRTVSLSLLNPLVGDAQRREQWLPVVFSVLDVGKDIDIVVLAAPKPLLAQPLPSVPIGEGVVLGGDCQFIGFPYGGGWRTTLKTDEKDYWFPFIKHCYVSGFAGGYDGEPRLLVLDGINNEGFSGGPVLSHAGAEQRIVAVISGYHTESAEVIAAVANRPNTAPAPEKHRKQVANVNSGFILASGMQFAIDAIQENPIGPLRP